MISYWLPTSLTFWVPLVFAITFGIAAVVAVALTLARRTEERDASAIAMAYGVGFGLVAVSEFLMYLDLAFGWSLAAAFTMASGLVTFFAVAAVIVAVLAIATAVLAQLNEERDYRQAHPAL
jgi:hypothetical protein